MTAVDKKSANKNCNRNQRDHTSWHDFSAVVESVEEKAEALRFVKYCIIRSHLKPIKPPSAKAVPS